MGQFTIVLPNNLHGNVRWGTIRKKHSFLEFFNRKKSGNEVKKGYIIKIETAFKEQKEYRLLKDKEGNWASEDDGGFQVTPNDPITGEIKKAIDDYENQK